MVVTGNAMIGSIAPPFGLLLFIMANITKQPTGRIVNEIWSLIVVLLIALAIFTFWPDFKLFPPGRVGHKG